MMMKGLIAAVASLALFTNAAQGATACTKGEAACQAATTFTILNNEKYCCPNSASISGTSTNTNGVIKTVCECSDEAPTAEVLDCLVGEEDCVDALSLTILNGVTYCCYYDDDTISTETINGDVSCKCTATSSTIPPEPEVPETGSSCCEGTTACADATSTSTLNGKTFCCPGGGAILAQSINGQEYCTCFAQQPTTCQFTNVLQKNVVGVNSGSCTQGATAALSAAAAVAAAAGVQV